MLRYRVKGTSSGSAPPPPQSGAVLTTFTLTSATTGSKEFSLALPLKKGATQGPGISTSIANSQCTVKRTWNDSSVKHVLIDGVASLTANTPLTVQVIDNPGVGGTNLTSANIASTLAASGQNVVNLGVNGSVDLSTLLASPLRTWKTGPFAVECHYQAVLSGILVTFYVRLYSTGKARIFCAIDNGWVTGNSDKIYTPTVTIGGSVVSSPGAITHWKHTRWFAVGWVGGDPGVTPTPNMPDAISTRQIPNYFMDTPPATTLNAQTQSYSVLGAADIHHTMGDTGYQSQIGILPVWDCLYVTSLGDSRAYNAMIANELSLNSFPIVWRSVVDNLPMRPSQFPTYAYDGNATQDAAPGAGGGGAQTPGTGAGLVWDQAHHPSGGYIGYMFTGEYVHLETMQLQSGLVWVIVTSANGSGIARDIKNGAVRQLGWSTRTLSQLCAISPADSVYSDFHAVLSNNAVISANEIATAPALNHLGIFYEYDAWASPTTTTSPTISPTFMHVFVAQGFGHASDVEPLTSMTALNSLRDHLYGIPVGLLGSASGSDYCFAYSMSDFRLQAYSSQPTNSSDSIVHPPLDDTWGNVWNRAQISHNAGVTCDNTLHGTAGSGSDPAGGATSFWANATPAIAFAVDHGAAGAQSSWSRLIGASNWLTVRNAPSPNDFASIPMFGIAPRDALSKLLAKAAPGTWIDAGDAATLAAAGISGVTAPSMSSVAPIPTPPGTGGSVIVTRGWSGGILDTNGNRIICWGGGHSDYAGNEVYAFDFATLNWRRLTNPSTSDTNSTGIYADGTPASRHTYGGLVFLPTVNKMLTVGGSVYSNGAFDNKNFLFDLSANTWANTGLTNNNFQVPDIAAVYNPADGKAYAIGGQSATSLQKYDVGLNAWSSVGSIAGLPGHLQTGALDQTNSRIVFTGDTKLYHVALATGALTDVSTSSTGDLTCQNYLGPGSQGAPGFDWYPVTSELVGFVPGDAAVYRLNPSTFAWTKHAAATANTVTPPAEDATSPSNGVFGRFRYSAKYNCFAAVVDYNGHVFFYKPDF